MFSFRRVLHVGITPSRAILSSFIGLIVIGALLLALPVAATSGDGLPLIDSFFISTSAVCVTGLSMVDLKNELTLFGQIVVMVLIQLGGLGLMTVSTVFVVLLGLRVNLRSRKMMQEALNQNDSGGIVRIVLRVVKFTFVIEAVGALLLSVAFVPEFGVWRGLYYGIFHAVSAFNNAGFDLMGNFQSLMMYTDSLLINVVIMLLIVLGGIGFAVMSDLISWRDKCPFASHTKIVLTTTSILIVSGTLIFLLVEWSNPATLGPLNITAKITAALFQSITTRTAGFNTIDTAGLHAASIVAIMVLMFIGASPMSTAGGVKTTTLAVIFAIFRASLRNEEEIVLFGRMVPRDIVQRAVTIVFLSLSWIMLAAVLLSLTENMAFMELLFEVVSAFGTVGLSIGATLKLTLWGKLIIIVTMLFGRVGPLTFALAFMIRRRGNKASISYPEEKILVG